tara:strand:+ start:330 stop:1196 length:867 start_codon:yes stop_codon:yes gene_type:complete
MKKKNNNLKARKRLSIGSPTKRFKNVTMLGTQFPRVNLQDEGEVSKIFYESDHSKFKFLEANRPIKQAHVDRLIGLLNEPKGQLLPVVINENYEVIEGQHRVKACMALKIPVMCVKIEGSTIEDVISMNTTQSGWNFNDYLHSHSQRSRPNYLEYRKVIKFLEDYKLSTTVSRWLLSGNNHDLGKKDFEEGTFKVKNLTYAETQGSYFNKIKAFNTDLPGKVKFGTAFIKVQNLPRFSMATCLKQLEKYCGKYFKQTGGNTEEMLECLIRCYNFNLSPAKKITNKILN